MIPSALTIAGSDPSGGAGLQADLKTFQAFGVWGTSAVTLLTVQNTRGVSAVYGIPEDMVRAQIQAVFEDIPPLAVKTGALGSPATVLCVADSLRGSKVPIVVDPVLRSKHGHPLAPEETARAILEYLLPLARVVTPNVHEAEALSGLSIATRGDAAEAARILTRAGAGAVVVKGLVEEGRSLDLVWEGGGLTVLEAPRLETRNTHGSGCVFAAAIAASLARGHSCLDAIRRAKDFVFRAIEQAPGLGTGVGPVGIPQEGGGPPRDGGSCAQENGPQCGSSAG